MKRFHNHRIDARTRELHAETRLLPTDFIPALFVMEPDYQLERIKGLDGTWHVGIDRLAEAIQPWLALGMDKVLLFGVPDELQKSAAGRTAWEGETLVARAIRRIKTDFPDLTVFTDVCLCAYTDHGHCGLLRPNGQIDNDTTLPLLAAMALSHARAGADWVAPSAMMDGQVAAIRKELDNNGFGPDRTKVLGYSAKFASAFYGPFRGAAASAPEFGDRTTYQMDPRNGKEALEEIAADLAEGASAVMVKPALNYLDVIARARDAWPQSRLAAYHTSGEFMALKAAAAAGVVDYKRGLSEQLHAIKRAGADWIIGYAGEEYLVAAKENP